MYKKVIKQKYTTSNVMVRKTNSKTKKIQKTSWGA